MKRNDQKSLANARREKVREMYTRDILVSEIAEHLGVSCPTIYKDLKILGLQYIEKGAWSNVRRKAMSKGMKKRSAQDQINYKIKPVCCVCGELADRKQYRKKNYCDEHLITAGNHDPDYEKRQRQNIIERRKEILND